MSEIETKAKNGPTQRAGECTGDGRKDDKGLGLFVILFVAGFVIGFVVLGMVAFPKLLYSKKEQPFNFDHQLHVGEAGDCDACHSIREDGSFTGIPKLDTCLECHADEPLGETEDEAVFVETYVVKEKEVPWLVYSRQPDCVFFSHAAHVGNTDCVVCHGHIGESTSSRPYEENRITGYSRDIWGKNIFGIKKHSWDRMKMDDCANCHKKETGHQGYCFQCHK